MNSNYTLIEQRDLPEQQSTGFLYAHVSGARILYMKNDDDNKVFNVTFKTPPYDSTGLPHILEHCVLNGSEKYPLKDPFGALSKGSLVTFLNAMTFNDKTMYPVASCNYKDFLNLMGVYLDAVYKPLIHSRDMAFLQEGWHYDLESPDGELTINGVVYNEMKGATSDPEDVLAQELEALVFPDSHYRFNSGGDPDVIPSLTYEDFKAFHKNLYHPSNSYILLYGDMDVEPCFKLLDEYLLSFDGSVVSKALTDKPDQTPPIAPLFAEESYSVAAGEDTDGKNYVGGIYILNDYPEPMDYTGMSVLYQILTETPASPLKNKLLEQKIGESVTGHVSTHFAQPCFCLLVKNSGYSGEKFKEAVDGILRELVEKGLDRKFVEACLNQYEFRCREMDTNQPKGLITYLQRMSGWIYGKNPFNYLNPLADIAVIRNKIANGEPYFENLIKTFFLDNPFAGFVTLKAEPGLQAKKDALLRDKLQAYKAGLSESRVTAIIEQSKVLLERQNTPDTPEALATIPNVTLGDIKREANLIPVDDSGNGLLRVMTDTAGVAYGNFLFDLSCLTKEEIPAAGMLIRLLGKLDTAKRPFGDLVSEINLNLGGVEFGYRTFGHVDGVSYKPALRVGVKALESKITEFFTITEEILTKTSFDDKGRIKLLLSEQKAEMESQFIGMGHQFGMLRAMSYISGKFGYDDLVRGFGYYEYLTRAVNGIDKGFDALRETLLSVSKKIFAGTQFTLAAACGDGVFGDFAARANGFANGLYEGSEPVWPTLDSAARNEAVVIESKVNYNTIAADCNALGYRYSGLNLVLSNVLNEGYLLQEVRVKGGAYGYGASFSNDGTFAAFSFRDPHVERTYKTYREMADFVAGFKPGDREMLQYVLGAINRLDRPKTPRMKVEHAAAAYLTGFTPAMQQAERDALLTADAAGIRALAPMLNKLVESNLRCTFGGEAGINANPSLFGHVVKI